MNSKQLVDRITNQVVRRLNVATKAFPNFRYSSVTNSSVAKLGLAEAMIKELPDGRFLLLLREDRGCRWGEQAKFRTQRQAETAGRLWLLGQQED